MGFQLFRSISVVIGTFFLAITIKGSILVEIYKKRILVETEYPGANVSCVSTERGLVLIDAPLRPADARDWGEKIRSHTGRDIAFLINTDHHYDHAMTDACLTDRVICHSTAARGILFLRNKDELRKMVQEAFPEVLPEIESDIQALEIMAPFITFDRKLRLNMGDASFNLEFMGGHSPGTILIELEEDHVLFTGDNVETLFPFFGQAHFKSWKTAFDRMLALSPGLVVPGHGQVGGRELIERYIEFFNTIEKESDLDSPIRVWPWRTWRIKARPSIFLKSNSFRIRIMPGPGSRLSMNPRPGPSWPDRFRPEPAPRYLPVKRGSRFSLNALMASCLSQLVSWGRM